MPNTIKLVKCQECSYFFTLDKIKWFEIWNGEKYKTQGLCIECSKEINNEKKLTYAHPDKATLIEMLKSGKANIKI
jgi:hypothetical protein